VFVDADVCVHPDALDRLRDTLARRPELSAAFGAYDSTPPALPLVSQYRNLLHAYVHRRDAGDVVTFWTGLGAVRREAFEHAGGFDEGERLDDVEFGYRLAACGHRILLDPKIQGTHLKRWTLTNVIRTDVRERAVPWVRLLLRLRHRVGPPTLSVRPSEWLLTGLTAIALLAVIAALMTGQGHWWIVAGVAALLLPVFDRGFLGWVAGERGGWFALRILPLRALYYVLNIVSIVIAFLPIPIRRRRGGKTLPFPGRVKEA
jgi:GT2 family glycosyltransferase